MTTEANQSGTRGHKITTSHRLSSRARVFTRVAAPRLTPDGSIVPVTGPLLHYYTITPPRVTVETHFTLGTGGGAGGHPAIVPAYKYILQFHSDDDRII